ncbi:ATP-binding protein [Salmonella enterica]
MSFQRAMRKQAKLRLALTGPSGSGKTKGALLIARGLGGRIAVIDTEKGSASLYADEFEFDVKELDPPYTPERFIDAMTEAAELGYDNLIIDSITHEWGGVGGCLDELDIIAKARFKGNSHAAWSEITPRHRKFLDALLRCPMHLIVTMRSKTETQQVEGSRKVVKLGMKAEQRDGIEYEFTTVLDLNHETHVAIASKDRTGLFPNDSYTLIDDQTGPRLMAWLTEGVSKAELDLKYFEQQVKDITHMGTLQAHFAEVYRSLRDEPDLQKKSQEVYEKRKGELSPKNAKGNANESTGRQ